MKTAERLLKCLLALHNKKLFLYQKNIEKGIEKRQKLCAKINLFFGKTILAQFFRCVFVDLSGVLAIKNSDFRREWRKSLSSIPFIFWKGKTCTRIKKTREKNSRTDLTQTTCFYEQTRRTTTKPVCFLIESKLQIRTTSL